MKVAILAVILMACAGSASAQSGFGSSDVTAGESATGADSFDVTGLVADDQTPSGKFTTAAEVGQILEMTKGNWAAVREYNGQDWVYFSHIMSWRCGLFAAKYSINEEPLQEMALPECHTKFQTPNALIDDDVNLISRTYELGSVKSIRIDLLLDNLTTQSVTLQRENILIP